MKQKIGGRVLGEGKSGKVFDMCKTSDLNDKDTFCTYVGSVLNKIKSVVLYTFDISTNSLKEVLLQGQDEILNFYDYLQKDENEALISKQYKLAASFTGVMTPKSSFDEEVNGVVSLIQQLGLDAVEKCTPVRFLQYENFKVIGVKLCKKLTLTCDFIMFYNKCEVSLEDVLRNPNNVSQMDKNTFINIVKSVLIILKDLQSQNEAIAHGDLKPANIMKCNDEWKLIDWNMSRKLTLDTLKEKDGIKPKHRGSSPFYYKLHNFPYVNAMIKNYVNDFMMAQFHPSKFDEFKTFLENSVQSFESVSIKQMDQDMLFQEFKLTGDLHSLGLIIYAVNSICNFQDVSLTNFAERLCMYNDNMVKDAQEAYTLLEKSVMTGGKNKKVFVLGRHRIIHTIKGKSYVTYMSKKITLTQAIKLDKKKK